MVVRAGAAELVDLRDHEVDRLEVALAVEVGHLVEGALQGALGRCAVVADDVVDQRVIEDIQLLEGVEHPPDLVVGVFHEAGVDLHFALEHRLEPGVHVIPGRDLVVSRGQLGVGADDSEGLLLLEGDLALLVPAVGERPLVLVGPFGWHVVRRVRSARREVGEEGLVGHECLLLVDPADGLVREVLGEVIALLGRLGRLGRVGALVQGRLPLVVFAADEAVEVLEATAAAGPFAEGPHGRGLPDRHLVALAELCGRVPVQGQRPGQGRLGVRQDRVIARG